MQTEVAVLDRHIKKMDKKVSIIIPIYKVEPYLKRCIDSIINQTYRNLEIILVDDESPDSCGKTCDDYAKTDDRIIVIHRKNGGLSCARNSGLDVATGEYITYADSDDYLELTMIDKMMYYVLKYDLDVMEIAPKTINSNRRFNNAFTLEDPISATKRILSKTAFSVWRRLFKKNIVEDMRFIPGLIHQDVFYTMDMLKRIKRNGYLDSPLYNYNTQNDSITRSKYSLEKIKTGIRATEYIVNNVIDHPILRISVANYLVYYYTDHYFLLSRNIYLDSKRDYRIKLRNTITKSLSLNNFSLRSLMVALLPFKVMEYISTRYQSIKSR